MVSTSTNGASMPTGAIAGITKSASIPPTNSAIIPIAKTIWAETGLFFATNTSSIQQSTCVHTLVANPKRNPGCTATTDKASEIEKTASKSLHATPKSIFRRIAETRTQPNDTSNGIIRKDTSALPRNDPGNRPIPRNASITKYTSKSPANVFVGIAALIT